MVFRPSFCLNIEYRGKSKGWCPCWWGLKLQSPLAVHTIWGFSEHNLVGSWDISLAYCGCSWYQHVVRLSCLPQLLHLTYSYEALGNFWVLVSKLLEVVLHVQNSTVQYSTEQYSTVQYSTVQYNIVQYNIHVVYYNTEQYSTIQYSTVQYSTVQYSINCRL